MQVMHPFRFIHTADLHLDSPFKGLSEIAPALQSALRDATFQAFENIITLCLKRKVTFLVISGDIHDAANRSLRSLVRLRSAFERLAEHDISVFMCHGNHDPLSGWVTKFTWPSNVTVFGPHEVEDRPVLQDGREIARVFGISYPTERVMDNLVKAFRKPADAPWSMGVLHTNVGQDPNHLNYAPCQLEDLIRTGMNYWALGHVHTHRVLHERDPLAVYPGNPQGRHAREQGARGCYFVEVDNVGHERYEFIPVDMVRWYERPLSIEGLRDFDELLSRFEHHVQDIRRVSVGRGAIVRWRLEGRGPLHREFAKSGRMEDLLATVREKWGDGSAFVWSETLVDRTSREIDLDVLRQEENLLGDFLRLAETNDERMLQEIRQTLDPLFDDPRSHRYLNTPSDGQLREWLKEAERLGLDRLLMNDE